MCLKILKSGISDLILRANREVSYKPCYLWGKKEEMKYDGNLDSTDQMLKADGNFKVKY